MSTISASRQLGRTVHRRRGSIVCLLAASVLFLCSAALQLAASLQRWVVFRASLAPVEVSAEDHLYDYFFPADPWESIETAAQLFGWGTLVQALGVAAMATGVVLLPRRAPGKRSASPNKAKSAALARVGELLLAVVLAAWLGAVGWHALASGAAGTPSPLQHAAMIGWLAVVALCILAARWMSALAPAAAACVFLLGSTWPGIVVATYMIAPVFAGGQSHDTSPWTETVMAATTAAAGISMLLAARSASVPAPAPAPAPSPVPS